MEDRKMRLIQIADDTLRVIEQGFYENKAGKTISIKNKMDYSIQNSILHLPDMNFEFDELPIFDTVIEITSESSLEAISRLTKEGHENIMCLNFASARTPGGGFKKGATAQEESLARSSGLYPCISQMSEMYEHNRQLSDGVYSDYMIFSPHVPIFKNDDGEFLDRPHYASFITAPAVNVRVVKEQGIKDDVFVLDVMKRRIVRILDLSLMHHQEALVLGAFGCGVFKNDPSEIAKLFYDTLQMPRYKNAFKKIVFAIYDTSLQTENLLPFQKVFINK